MQLKKMVLVFTAGLMTLLVTAAAVMANAMNGTEIANPVKNCRQGGYQQKFGEGQFVSYALCQNAGILMKTDQTAIEKILRSEPYRGSG